MTRDFYISKSAELKAEDDLDGLKNLSKQWMSEKNKIKVGEYCEIELGSGETYTIKIEACGIKYGETKLEYTFTIDPK